MLIRHRIQLSWNDPANGPSVDAYAALRLRSAGPTTRVTTQRETAWLFVLVVLG